MQPHDPPEPRVDGLRARLSEMASPVVDVVLGSIDPDEVLDRVDVDGVVQRIDVDELVARMDVDALLDRVDVDRVLDRVDVDALLDRVDVERLMARIDVEVLVERAGVPEIVRASTQNLAGSALDAARRYVLGLDLVVTRGLRRLLHRDHGALPVAPRLLADPVGVADGTAPRSVSGRYAGLLNRLVANGLDAVIAVGSFTLVTAAVVFVLATVFDVTWTRSAGPEWLIGAAVWSFLLLWGSLAATGKTPGAAIVGLRVVTREGAALPPGRCAVRVLVLPLSASLFGLGYVGIVLGRERRALHDVAAGSAVVYDWGDRPATMPTPLERWADRDAARDR